MIERILKDWKTTTAGAGLALLAIGLVWFGKATLTEVSAFLVAALALLFSKDPENNDNTPTGYA